MARDKDYDSSGEEDEEEDVILDSQLASIISSLTIGEFPDLLSQLNLQYDNPLPPEIYLHVFHYLDQHHLVHRISVLNSTFRRLIFEEKFSHLIWDFRLVRFSSSSACFYACCTKKIFAPKHIRIKSYRSRDHLMGILGAVGHRVEEFRIKTISSSFHASSLSKEMELAKFLDQLSLPMLKKCAFYEVHPHDKELVRKILLSAPNLIHIDFIPSLNFLIGHPNWHNFQTLIANQFEAQMSQSSIQKLTLELQQLRVLDIRSRINCDVLEQAMSLPNLTKANIYCGRSLRKAENHFMNESIGISSNLKRVKFTKCKSMTKFLERCGTNLTHLQLFTCNPFDSRIQFQNYSNLLYLSSFKSITMSQLIQIATGCKKLKCVRFKPVYDEQTMSHTDWTSLLLALSGTETRHLELSRIHFENDAAASNTTSWFSLLSLYLPQLVSIMLSSISSSNTSPNNTPYKPMMKLKRYEVSGDENFKSDVNHLRLFEAAPNLVKVIFKQRDMSFEELMKLSRSCLSLKELYIQGSLIQPETKPIDFRFSSFEKLSKVFVTMDGKKNTLTDVLLTAFCFYRTPHTYLTIENPNELWMQSSGMIKRQEEVLQERLRTLSSGLINLFDNPNNRAALKFQFDDAIKRLSAEPNAKPISVIEMCLRKLVATNEQSQRK